MRSKAPLAMMEQMVMLLVFGLAAALCMQAFVKADALSQRREERDRAAVLCQNAAEAVQACQGDMERAAALLGENCRFQEDSLFISYFENWEPQEGSYQPQSDAYAYQFGYVLGVGRMESEVPGLGKACVWLQKDEPWEELFRMEFCWQEDLK